MLSIHNKKIQIANKTKNIKTIIALIKWKYSKIELKRKVAKLEEVKAFKKSKDFKEISIIKNKAKTTKEPNKSPVVKLAY